MKQTLDLNNQQKFKRVQHYQFLQLLGKGANGLVYKGLNAQDGSFVAIKQMIIGRSEMKAIKTQLGFLKKLDHPSIVKYIDAVQKDNRIYLILEYIEGGSLGALAKKSNLSEGIVKLYIKQVLVGLNFLHKEGVIHRDIKGANILITKHGKVKLADFGVAIKIQQSQKTISAAGSPYWIAPEIIIGQSEPSVKCDIWSVGCTIIQLLTGNPPYFQLMQFPALFRIVEDEHPPLPLCSPECKNFLLKCFIKNPTNRPDASQLLMDSWLKTNQKQSIQLQILNQRQHSLQRQIQAALVPKVNHQNLLVLLEKVSGHTQIIYHHSAFYNFIKQLKQFPQSSINKGWQQNTDELLKTSTTSSKKYSNGEYNDNTSYMNTKIIYKLIEDNISALEYLDMIGLVSQQIQFIIKFIQELLPKQHTIHNNHSLYNKLLNSAKKDVSQLISASVTLIRQIIKLHIKNIERYHSHCYYSVEQHYSGFNSGQSSLHSVYNIFPMLTKQILPLVSRILQFYSFKESLLITINRNSNILITNEHQKEQRLIKQLLITSIYQLIVLIKQQQQSQNAIKQFSSHEKDRNTQHHQTQIVYQHFLQIMNSVGILEQLFSLNEDQNMMKNGEDQLEIYLLKLEIQLKIVPRLVKLSHRYISYLRISIENLLKHGLIPEYLSTEGKGLSAQHKEQLIIGRMLLINQFAEFQAGRCLLERNGIIYYLAKYYKLKHEKISVSMSQNQVLQLLQITHITYKMLFTDSYQHQIEINELEQKQYSVDPNRVQQISRHFHANTMDKILVKLKEGAKKQEQNKLKGKKGSNFSNYSLLLARMQQIRKIISTHSLNQY